MKRDPNSVGDIVTEKNIVTWSLRLIFFQCWRNSGIKYFVDALEKGDGRGIGLSIKYLRKHPDHNQGVGGNRTIGSLYDLIAAENLSEKNRDDIRANSSVAGIGENIGERWPC